MPHALSELVSDWGGFEQLVAKLNEIGDVTVEHNVVLPGRSGAPRQIDVLIRHKQGLYEHLIVAECKYRNQAIERIHVDALATTIREVGASKGVIFSTRGFQSGAITQASHEHIDLFKVREPTEEEWGLPGRVVEITLQVISISIGSVQNCKAFAFDNFSTPINLNLTFNGVKGDSLNKVTNTDKDETIEGLIEKSARDGALKIILNGRAIPNGSYDLEILYRSAVQVILQPARIIRDGTRLISICEMTIEIGVHVTQTHIVIDRAEQMAFVLAIEDCVSNTVVAATRRKGSDRTELVPLRMETVPVGDEVFQNGSTLRVLVGGLMSFQEFNELTPGTMIVRPGKKIEDIVSEHAASSLGLRAPKPSQ